MKRRVCVMTVLALASTIPASAQILGRDRPERPNRAVFGSTRGLTGQLLVLNGAVGAGGLDIGAGTTAEMALNPTTWNWFESASLGAAYTLDREWIGVDSSIQTSLRHFPALDDTSNTVFGNAGLVWRAPLGDRTRLDGHLSASYQPVSVATLFPGLVTGAGAQAFSSDFNLAGQTEQYLTGSTGFEISHSFSRRSSLAAQYEYARAGGTDIVVGRQDQTASVRYGYEIIRGLTAQAGYVNRRGTYASGGDAPDSDIRSDSIDAGVGYSHALSLSRRTQLMFSSGSTVISDGETRRFDFVGNASLTREIGRSWQAMLTYDRHAGFVDTLAAPVIGDAVSASSTGLITRRISFTAGAGATRGQVGLRGGNNYWSYQGNVQLGFAFSRIIECAFDYVAYSYKFDRADFVPVVAGTRATQQIAQVSLGFWVPLFERVRRPHATR